VIASTRSRNRFRIEATSRAAACEGWRLFCWAVLFWRLVTEAVGNTTDTNFMSNREAVRKIWEGIGVPHLAPHSAAESLQAILSGDPRWTLLVVDDFAHESAGRHRTPLIRRQGLGPEEGRGSRWRRG
jgi:hypothetical protein